MRIIILCRNTLLLFLIFLFGTTELYGQNAKVHVSPDSVKKQTSGKPIIYANAHMVSNKTVVGNLSQLSDYAIFFNAIKKVGLTQTFNSRGPLTFFIPPDSAFRKLSKGTMDTLMTPVNKFELVSLLTYHAVPGMLRLKDINKLINKGKGKTTLITLAGSKIIASNDLYHHVILTDEHGNQSVICQENIKQDNGIVHIITAVLLPKRKTI